MNLRLVDPALPDCAACRGEGRVANTPDREPWSVWASLPASCAVAMRLGLVGPMPCPACRGSGKEVRPPLSMEDGALAEREDWRTAWERLKEALDATAEAGRMQADRADALHRVLLHTLSDQQRAEQCARAWQAQRDEARAAVVDILDAWGGLEETPRTAWDRRYPWLAGVQRLDWLLQGETPGG